MDHPFHLLLPASESLPLARVISSIRHLVNGQSALSVSGAGGGQRDHRKKEMLRRAGALPCSISNGHHDGSISCR